MLLSERSIISWVTGTGVLKEELIERDSAAISAYYLDRGFMDITVGAPKIDYEEDGIVGTADDSINVVSWTEKVWLGNKKAGNIFITSMSEWMVGIWFL